VINGIFQEQKQEYMEQEDPLKPHPKLL